MNKEKLKLKHQIAKLEAALLGFEVKLIELDDEKERILEHAEIQKQAIKDKKAELDELD